jgi:hypothetical protein
MRSEKGDVTTYRELFGGDLVSDAASRMAQSILGAIRAWDSLLDKAKRFLRYFSSSLPVLKPSQNGISLTVASSFFEPPLEPLARFGGTGRARCEIRPLGWALSWMNQCSECIPRSLLRGIFNFRNHQGLGIRPAGPATTCQQREGFL